MKFFSSAFDFNVAKLHLANYKTVREENQFRRFFIMFANVDLATVCYARGKLEFIKIKQSSSNFY